MILLSPSFGEFRSGEPKAYELGNKWVKHLSTAKDKKIVLEEGTISLIDDKLYVSLRDDENYFEFEVIGL